MAIGQCWAKDDNSEAAVVDEQLTRLVVNASVRGMNLGYEDDPYSDRHESTRSASYIPISRCFSHSTPILLWDFPIILDGLIRMSSKKTNRKSNFMSSCQFFFAIFNGDLIKHLLCCQFCPLLLAADGPTSCTRMKHLQRSGKRTPKLCGSEVS